MYPSNPQKYYTLQWSLCITHYKILHITVVCDITHYTILHITVVSILHITKYYPLQWSDITHYKILHIKVGSMISHITNITHHSGLCDIVRTINSIFRPRCALIYFDRDTAALPFTCIITFKPGPLN